MYLTIQSLRRKLVYVFTELGRRARPGENHPPLHSVPRQVDEEVPVAGDRQRSEEESVLQRARLCQRVLRHR